MRRALEISKKGFTHPNPMVGALIVCDGKVLSEGFHSRAGMPHAEREALRGIDASGATLYVTLEPCSHHGRTPPCTDAIIESGIRRVVCAMRDPNPLVSGIEILRDAGIEVEVGLLGDEARRLNEAFVTSFEKGRPFILSKCAATLDGKIATSSGESKWISSEESRDYTRSLRGRFGAICVGIRTVLADDPSLGAPRGPDPLRVILDSTLRIPPDSCVLRDSNALVITTERYDRDAFATLEDRGVAVAVCGREKVDFKGAVAHLFEKGIRSVLVEGGGEVHASAFASGLVDRVIFIYSPRIVGGAAAPGMVSGPGIGALRDAVRLEDVEVSRIGADICVTGRVQTRE